MRGQNKDRVNAKLMNESESNMSDSDVPCFCSQRWILAYLGFTFGTIFSMYRIDMSMAVVCMVKDDTIHDVIAPDNTTESFKMTTVAQSINTTDTSILHSGRCEGEILQRKEENMNAEFTWSRQTQSVVLSSFFYGFVTTQIIGGWLIVRVGGKNVITVAMALSSVFTMLIPVLARTHVIGVIIARVLTGIVTKTGDKFGKITLLKSEADGKGKRNFVCFLMLPVVVGPLPPAWFSLLGKWALPDERGRMMMMFWIGQTAGAVIGITTSGVLCTHGFDNGWGSIFYLHGICGIVFLVLWLHLAASSPDVHPRITELEKKLLAKYLHEPKQGTEKETSVPWLKIFTSVPVWAIFITQLCDNWLYYLILTCLPMFVNEILKYDIQSNGFYSSLPFFVTVLSLVTSGVLTDYVNKKRWMSRTTNRKLFQIISLLVSSGFLVLSSYLSCDKRQLVILCISVCTFFLYLAYASGYPCNIVDMTPRYGPFLYGVSNTIGASAGFWAPLVVGFLTKRKTIEEWRFVFWISAGLGGIGALVYGLFSSSELQAWDPAYRHTIEIELVEKQSKVMTKYDETQLDTDSEQKTKEPLIKVPSQTNRSNLLNQ